MLGDLFFREQLASVSQWIVEELDKAYAVISGTWNQEHDTDGTHTHVTASQGYSEHGRSVKVGEWADIPITTATFSGSGSMTWTVNAADVTTLRYSVVGNTMTVLFYLVNTSVGGVASTSLEITIPSGYRISRSFAGVYGYSDNGGATTAGFCDALKYVAGTVYSGERIRLFLSGFGNWAAAANTTNVFGSIAFEVTEL